MTRVFTALARIARPTPKAADRGSWVFIEGKAASCRDCKTQLAHSWALVVGSTVERSLCTRCVAPHLHGA